MFYFKYNLIFNMLLYICIVYCMAIFCLPGLQVSGHDTTCADFWTNFLPPFAEGYFYKSENNKIDSHIHIKKKKINIPSAKDPKALLSLGRKY